ncbi:hypothetical protein HBI56_103780 [Parastagonospora nodorum]|uniref:Uncharacterized protein n=1 Tax=Phaeosphaeria nodorum (strain SN15 / ATCC MYA-4574 / FGSC 10173) TaxID=321614 RepID=A0A7U2I7M8_PHANO|nr:hypothetical protein HBH56_135110 [Parastagonospora nodorum]QRD02613.1 hypothetical protein JI435_113660 [Parastagonospora nodorum SN15]KAH3926937.1 hypothetical protein HBH54_158180 [Parastagonospora nodorum]KAH3949311.1 hypothetical protein HBH53_090200 [Parastagonospora nodorum]KAH3958910.1 hypothetical protein HBH51_205320 [Parastagonospora nodorum]
MIPCCTCTKTYWEAGGAFVCCLQEVCAFHHFSKSRLEAFSAYGGFITSIHSERSILFSAFRGPWPCRFMCGQRIHMETLCMFAGSSTHPRRDCSPPPSI